MRRLLPLLARTTPFMARKLFLPTVFTINMMIFGYLPAPKCIEDPFILSQTISDIDKNVIKIENNGNLVGEAFCFAENYLVSVSYNIADSSSNTTKENYKFVKDGKKLQGTFRMVGQFQNLLFFEHTSNDPNNKIRPLQTDDSKNTHLIFPVQIFLKREYPSVRNGYMVAKDEGYGVVDGRGELGSLIIKNGKAAGIVTQIGRDLESGFLRFIEWKDLPKILNYLKKGKNMQLGISAQAKPFKQGIDVVRIAPNSFLREGLMMGDTIVKVNGHKIREVQALQRVCILSEGDLTLDIIRDNEVMEVKVKVDY